jgi:hypothetical protein
MTKEKAEKVKVKFLEDAIYESEGPHKGPHYDKGSIHEFDEEFAQRWIRRGVAEEVDKATKTTEVTPAPKAEPAKEATKGEPAKNEPPAKK